MIRDASTGLLYWLARGILWFGIISVLLVVFGSISWFINGVLLPQIQKQVALELFEKQRELIGYIKLFISATILVAGIEIGFAITPFGPFAPNDLWGVVLEIFIITPILAITAWWYLAYIKFISFRLSATQVGNIFSPWKSRFIKNSLGFVGSLLLYPRTVFNQVPKWRTTGSISILQFDLAGFYFFIKRCRLCCKLGNHKIIFR